MVVASAASFPSLPGLAAYAASKAGVESLTNALRLEVAHLGVGVGCAHPSWIDTDLVRNAERDLQAFRRMRAKLPWPVNATTDVETCAREMANAIERRATRLFIPRGVALVRWLRSTPLVDAGAKRQAPTEMPQLEAEVAAMLADHGVRAWGVEASRTAIDLARHNVPAARFTAGTVERVLARLPARTDLIVLDPPRSGAGRDVMRGVLRRKPRAIAYVACDPAPLARDLRTAHRRDVGVLDDDRAVRHVPAFRAAASRTASRIFS